MSNKEGLGILLSETARAWKTKLDQRLKPLGLSQAKWLVLINLHISKDPLTQKDLSEKLSLEGPSLVRLLDRMESDGWVERQVSSSDRRAKTVHPTAKASATTQEIKRVASALRRELLQGIPEQELDVAYSVIDKIKQRLEQI